MWPFWKSLFYSLVSRRYRHYKSNYLAAAASEFLALKKSVPEASLTGGAIMLGHHFFVEEPSGGSPIFDCLKLQDTTLALWFNINQGVLAAILEHLGDVDEVSPSQLHGTSRIHYFACRDSCPLDRKFDLVHYSDYLLKQMSSQTKEVNSHDVVRLLSISASLGAAVSVVRRSRDSAKSSRLKS